MAIGPKAEAEADVVGRQHADGVPATLTVAVVTPKGQLAAHKVDEVIAPGADGEFGVLPGHVPTLAALRPGVCVLRDGAKLEIFAVGKGFLKIGVDGKVHVLVDQALAPDDIDAGAARAEQEKLERELATAESGAPAITEKIAWAQARLDAVARKNPQERARETH